MALDERLHRFTTAEYDEIVATGALADVRTELLDGLLVDKVTPQEEEHVAVTRRLMQLFAARSDLLFVQMPLIAQDGWVPEPDLLLATLPAGRQRPSSGLLVVEVAVSTKGNDLRKAGVYAAAGIPRYWLLDVPDGVILEHTDPGPDGYGSVDVLRGADVLDPHVDGIPTTTVADILSPAR